MDTKILKYSKIALLILTISTLWAAGSSVINYNASGDVAHLFAAIFISLTSLIGASGIFFVAKMVATKDEDEI